MKSASVQIRSVQSLSRFRLFATLWTAPRQASLSFTNSWSLLKLMSIESVMPSNHLILCRPLLLPSIFPSIRVFSNESALRIRWPDYWSFSLGGCGSSSFYFCHMSHLLGISSYRFISSHVLNINFNFFLVLSEILGH